MGELVKRVRDELLAKVKLALDDYGGRERKEWLFDHLAQLCIVCTQARPPLERRPRVHSTVCPARAHAATCHAAAPPQAQWTSETDNAFDEIKKGDKGALKTYAAKQREQLSELIALVQGELDKLQRRKVMNLITMETHSRDIVISLIEDDFDTKDCFK